VCPEDAGITFDVLGYNNTYTPPPPPKREGETNVLSNCATTGFSRNMLQLNLKGKGHPRTGHEVPEGEPTYGSTLSLPSLIAGGGWGVNATNGPLSPRNDQIPTVRDAG
jgi:hypothetical protein